MKKKQKTEESHNYDLRLSLAGGHNVGGFTILKDGNLVEDLIDLTNEDHYELLTGLFGIIEYLKETWIKKESLSQLNQE